jgi:hypothetical protein
MRAGQGAMQEQEISWGWALLITFGVFWRWIIACLAAVFAVTMIFMTVGRIAGQSGQLYHQAMTQITVGLWLLALIWAIAAALRARHGRFRQILVSAEESAAAFD